MKRQNGLSLTEIMISLLLSCLLMSLLIKQYLVSKQQYHQSQLVLEADYELQLVSEALRDSIRSAGFAPCLGITHLIIKDRRSTSSTPLNALSVSNDNHLTISRMSHEFSEVQSFDVSHLLLDTPLALPHGAPLIIADCFHAEIQMPSHFYSTAQGMMLVLDKPLAFDYVAPIYVGEWIEEHFFIAKQALYYANRHPEALSSLIKSMTVQKTGLLVRITLGLVNDVSIRLDTMIRTP